MKEKPFETSGDGGGDEKEEEKVLPFPIFRSQVNMRPEKEKKSRWFFSHGMYA